MLTRRLLHLRTRVPIRTPLQQSRAPLRWYGASPQAQHDASRNRAAVGTFDWRAAAVFIVTGVGLYAYFEREKAQVQERKRIEVKSQKYGKALVGGPFSLISAGTGNVFTEKDLLGHWSLIYFGFTNCPDICPDELDKMSAVVNEMDKRHGGKGEDAVLPVFISCDPARDTVKEVKKYITDFHPKMVGLTGSYEDVKATCRTYRVYFSTPPNMKPGDDYLVDHSIFFYLMDPAGQFVDAFGKTSTAEEVCTKFEEARLDWQERQSIRGIGVQARE